MLIKPVIVPLTWPEICICVQVGGMRQVQNMKTEAKSRYGADDLEDWNKHIVSCHGEMGAAKYLDRFWSGNVGNKQAADVGACYQVRATAYPQGRLLLHPNDHDHMPYILARVIRNQVILVGWVYGREGKQKEYWTTLPKHPNRPAFFVPDDVLHDMTTVTEIETVTPRGESDIFPPDRERNGNADRTADAKV
jgi:hypothetical protein